jgi:RNA polymerase sigma factor (sigma-70 family)
MTPHSLDETPPDDDGELLETWKRQRCGAAFTELVRRHMGMVHGVALRRTAQPAIAEDVTQTVFTLLARKASRLKPGPLAPWLHRAAVMEAAKAIRSESRHRRKLHAYALHCETECQSAAMDSSETLLPRLDAAIDALPERFRHVLVLRFYEGLSFREIACRTGESEAAAQRRGHRALGRLEKTLRTACGAALAGISHAASNTFTITPATIAARAAAAVPVHTGIQAILHTMHPAALVASTAAVTTLLLSIPLTLQVQRAGDAEHRLAEALAAGASRTPARMPSAVTAATTALASTPAVAALPDAESKRREDARAYAVKTATDDERKIMERLKERLQFTPEQEKAVAAWHAQSRELRQSYAEKRRLREPYDPAFFAIEYGFHPDIPPQLQSILTPDQKRAYAKWEQERRTNYTEGWSGSELSFLADPLELTAEQKDQVYAKLHGIWSEYSTEDLTVLKTVDAIAAHKNQNHQSRLESLTSILTPAQFTKWEKLSLDWNREMVRRYQDPQPSAPNGK